MAPANPRARWQHAVGCLLGVVLVLHGLGSSVLPLRGADVLGPGVWMPAITLLYVTAIVGFVVAGLGVLGVWPLRAAAAPAAFAGGVAGLMGLTAQLDRDLWPGVVLNFGLPMCTAVFTLMVARDRPVATRGWRRRAVDVLGLTLLAWVTVSAVAWPWHRSWGTTPVEWEMTLPGDRTPRTPEFEILHAITIDAPPSAVWAWLVQLGQDRAGFYSYDWLERLFGAEVHNVAEIRPEWQTRSAGDHVYATQSGYLGGIFGERPGWVIDAVEPGRALVLRNWGAFVLMPQDDGRTRLLIRSTISNEQIPAWLAAFNMTAFELPHFIMQRRMMLRIKELAEET